MSARKVGVFLGLGLISITASALNVQTVPGVITKLQSPSNRTEVCVQANHLMVDAYKDKDLKQEKELCGLNFYTDHATCPKLNSTNPGVLITELLEGKSREATIRMCASGEASVEAKFKSSISCSYTPSILAYYHFSRMLKAGNVPVAVLRTMDRDAHLSVVDQALKILGSRPSEAIYKTWSSFLKVHQNNSNLDILDDSKQFIYGALSDNPKKEYRYTEVSGVGSYDTRYERFKTQAPFLKVANTNSLSSILGVNTDYRKSIQTVVQMKDVSDMILLDTLFSQDDRIGNIHYKLAWYKAETDATTHKTEFNTTGSKAQLSSDKKTWVIPENEKAIQASGAVLVKEILLKDNDCGVNVNVRSNMMRKISAIESVRHMSGRTYKKFIQLYKLAQAENFKSWMRNEMLFSAADLGQIGATQGRSFYANLQKAYTVLTSNCKSGVLKLDLNVDELIPGSVKQTYSCE